MTQSVLPTEILEQRAAEQRRALHNDVRELRSVVRTEVRERTDVRRLARRYFAPMAGATALVALTFGYGVTGIFTRDRG